MALFLLVRHGDNDTVGKFLAGRTPGVHLNDSGKNQAQQLSAVLSRFPIKAIFSSPLERAQETAEPIARAVGLNIEIIPEFNEIDFGDWEGENLEELGKDALWPVVQEHPSQFQFPGGETFQAAQRRVVAGLRKLNKRFTEADVIVCVAHCDVIRLAVAHFLGVPLDNFQKLQISPASVSVLTLNGEKASLGPINYTIEFPKIMD